jgi:site-specific recombinase XerD
VQPSPAMPQAPQSQASHRLETRTTPARRHDLAAAARSHLPDNRRTISGLRQLSLLADPAFTRWSGRVWRLLPQRAPKALDERAAKRFLRAVEACPSARDRAIALVPFYAGARIAEVAALDIEDVQLSARKGGLHLVGKGEKSRDVPVVPELREALHAWLAERPETEDKALFVSRRGRSRMTTDAIDDVIHRIIQNAGLDDEVTAHVLRHTYPTVKIRNGVDIVSVAQLMGHAKLDTTRAYTRPSEADLEKAAMVRYTD